MAMSPRQARVVDPILSNHARGYRNNEHIGRVLFPIVTMPTRGAKRIEFGKEGFRKIATRRAPGTQITRLQFGYEGKTVDLQQHALAAMTPIEHVNEAEEVPGIDLQRIAVNLVADVVELQLEIDAATKARNASAYGANNKVALAGAARWTSATSTPKKDVSDASDQIRSQTGRRPNTMILGPSARNALDYHPALLDFFKHVTEPSITDEMLARYFKVPRVVSGDAIFTEDGIVMQDVWGDDVILAYVAPESNAQMALPSYGYTYQLSGYPSVSPVRFDEDFKSFVNDYTNELSAELVGADAGFLIQNAGAAA